MTEKQFFNNIANSRDDVLQQFLDLLEEQNIDYCVVGGLAVNAYVEPVVSLDLDLVIASDSVERLTKAVGKIFAIKKFEHSVNLKSPQSDLRIQLQMEARYQAFIAKASKKNVMGYEMKVAAVEDVLQGKLWAYSDQTRRKSKRQKDLADIFRLVEAFPELHDLLPESISKRMG